MIISDKAASVAEIAIKRMIRDCKKQEDYWGTQTVKYPKSAFKARAYDRAKENRQEAERALAEIEEAMGKEGVQA